MRSVRPPAPLLVRRYVAPGPDDDALRMRKSKRRLVYERTKDPSFVDRVFMFAAAGTGGDGAVSFTRAKGLPVGPPGGGDGSRGGSIYVQVDSTITSLGHIGNVGGGLPRSLTEQDEIEFAEQTSMSDDEIPVVATVRAPDGEHGKGSDIDGRRVPDRVIRVPPGTVVKVKYLHPDFLAQATDIVRDLEKPEEEQVDEWAEKLSAASSAPNSETISKPLPLGTFETPSEGTSGPHITHSRPILQKDHSQVVDPTTPPISEMTLAQLEDEEATTEQALQQVESKQRDHERKHSSSQDVATAEAEEEEAEDETSVKLHPRSRYDEKMELRAQYEDELIFKGFFAKSPTGRRPPLSLLNLLAPTADKTALREKLKELKSQIAEGEQREAARMAERDARKAESAARAEAWRARFGTRTDEDAGQPPEEEVDEELDEEAEFWAQVERKRQREWSKTPEAAAERMQEAAEDEAQRARLALFWRYMVRTEGGGAEGEGLDDLLQSGWQQRTFLEAEERAGRLLLQQRHERLRAHLERVRSYRKAAQEHAAQMALHDPRRAIRAEEHMTAWDFVIDLNDVVTANALAQAGGSLIGGEAAGATLGQRSAPILLAQGGMGGMGNVFFYTGRDRSPKLAMRGAMGEVIRVMLELKSAGDVGLVGFPNAGKSTLLQALTGADGENGGRVGGWAFTTLNPSMGVLRLGSDGKVLDAGISVIGDTAKRVRGGTGAPVTADETPEGRALVRNSGPEADLEGDAHSTKYRRLLAQANRQERPPDVEEIYRLQVADLPGLIEGASVNIGLGHAFLQHVERCAVLTFVVNLAAKDDELPAWETLRILFNELEAYQPGLSARATMVIANKADQLDRPGGEDEAKATLQRLKDEVKALHAEQIAAAARARIPPPPEPMDVIPVAAKYRLNVDRVARRLCEQHKVVAAKEEMEPEATPSIAEGQDLDDI